MNVLSIAQQTAVISALTEGCSIRSAERLTGIHRDTVMRLAARVGFGAIKLHDRTVHSLQVGRIELDEAWSFVGKKQRKDARARSCMHVCLFVADYKSKFSLASAFQRRRGRISEIEYYQDRIGRFPFLLG